MIRLVDNNNLSDSRSCKFNLLDKNGMSVAYTLTSDDITKGEKVSATPFVDREDKLIYKDGVYYGEKTKTEVTADYFHNGIIFNMTCYEKGISQYGINLPFNFMGKIGGGGWRNQFLFNSPYISKDRNIIYAYLTNPQGNNLLVAVLSPAHGWKMDYSPYLWAHYFVNLKLLSSYDRAYNMGDGKKSLTFAILPVTDFDSCQKLLAEIYSLPFLSADINGGKIGESIKLKCYGEVDYLIEKTSNGEEKNIPFEENYTLKYDGEVSLIPVFQGKRGQDITVYAYPDIFTLYKRSSLSVDLDLIKAHTDSNLCEHQCWASANLRFLQKYKDRLTKEETEKIEGELRSFLSVLCEENEEKAIPRITIFNKPHGEFPAYNVYKSKRVQELYHGIVILLDAYKYFRDEKYLMYAKGATNTLLSHYQDDDGGIYIDWCNNGHKEDYSSVCCPMIPIVDIANLTNDKEYFRKAKMLADHLYNRGLSFPTEGGTTDVAETEMEEGSISCTALNLLYYCKYVKNEEKYLTKAKEILDIHENWVIKSAICQMNGSTLRWWETQWEGDGDGPAICAGHAWSIWRAEADCLYYLLTRDEDYLKKATRGFLTNLSKIQSDGTSYSIYNPDEINGGGFVSKCSDVKFQIAPHFASIKDSGISRYVWIRLANYI